MKKKIIKWIALCLTAVFLTCSAALPVFAAALSEEEAAYLLESTKEFVGQIMGADEMTLSKLLEQEGFYAIAARAVLDSREEIGAFEGVKDGSFSQEGSNVTILVDIDAEKYDAQVEITYNSDEEAPKNFVINPNYPLSVNMANAGRNTIIGLVVVFVVLILLSFVISLFKHIGSGSRNKQKEPDDEPAGIPDAEEKELIVPAAAAASAGDEEIIAVIAAAIAAAEADSSVNGSSYVVRSIRKMGSGKRWKRV